MKSVAWSPIKGMNLRDLPDHLRRVPHAPLRYDVARTFLWELATIIEEGRGHIQRSVLPWATDEL